MNETDKYFKEFLLLPLEGLISELGIEKYNPAIEKLLELNKKYERIADFGCGGGDRTLSLMLRLGANEAIGIDKEQQNIDDALRFVADGSAKAIKEDIQKIKDFFTEGHQLTDDDLQARVESLRRYKNISIPNFIKSDITKGEDGTRLPRKHFDLVYCRFVLYNIYCEDTPSFVNTRSAIQEMTEVAKSGGLVVAYEFNNCPDGTQINLAPLFEVQDDLQLVNCVVLPDDKTIYIYISNSN